jgi:hypothetical protein
VVTPAEDHLLRAVVLEIEGQDLKHGPFEGSRLGRSRLALACIQDELREAEQAWRDERKQSIWTNSQVELIQVAAVAIRALRDAFSNEVAVDEIGASIRSETAGIPWNLYRV